MRKENQPLNSASGTLDTEQRRGRARVTFLLGRPDNTGGDRVIGRYATALASRGYDVRLVSISHPRSLQFYDRLPLLNLARRPFPSSKFDYVRAGAALVSRVEHDPGVVVATWTPTLPLAWMLSALRGGRGVIWLQQDYPLMFEGLRWESWLVAHGRALAQRVVAVSEACARYVAPGGAPEVHVIHSGLEEVFYRPASPEPEGILFVGDPIERKGWPVFRRAMARLWETGHRVPVTVVSRAGEALLPPGVEPPRVLRDLSDAELAREYAGARVFVCASLAEGWGLPALEAMAAGCPVVTTRHEGCRAYARHGENCLLVPPGDEEALAEAVRRILQDDDLRRVLVSGGVATAKRYSWSNATDAFEEVIGDVLRG